MCIHWCEFEQVKHTETGKGWRRQILYCLYILNQNNIFIQNAFMFSEYINIEKGEK